MQVSKKGLGNVISALLDDIERAPSVSHAEYLVGGAVRVLSAFTVGDGPVCSEHEVRLESALAERSRLEDMTVDGVLLQGASVTDDVFGKDAD